MQRLSELNAAGNLSYISHLPPARLHELSGKQKNQFSVDLDHPYRLLFTPDYEVMPQNEDGGIDKEKVEKIKILGIKDTH